jgi:hypothetical protein
MIVWLDVFKPSAQIFIFLSPSAFHVSSLFFSCICLRLFLIFFAVTARLRCSTILCSGSRKRLQALLLDPQVLLLLVVLPPASVLVQ